MLTSVLSFTPEQAATVTEYCTNHSEDVSPSLKELWDRTVSEFDDSDKMSSPLQSATFKFLAELLRPRRILEIGCYTGYSALTWYEATINTRAEITSLELDSKMIAASKRTFARYGVEDRVKLIEGPAQESLQKLTGTFDLIFVDANKDGYETYVKQILDKNLLARDGVIIADNIFARGMTISEDCNPHLPEKVRPYWTANGKALQKFNTFLKNDPRVDVVLLPVFDGLTLIKLKPLLN
ncbi:O-methyltransferase [Chaetomium sp. MPI-SDFR-AT-0129]|uniref:O-methyltransferase n=1 Tax=Dichotomopilus funicola TaxID=1934379 RepID=A0AAN6UYZ7_9PEZI|nr:O-methyltransferase [Chaetomium sp. MPI-SDFR-AT-0129]KAK4141484.1 O-methyltransferase [Dichotomopilus funicola]